MKDENLISEDKMLAKVGANAYTLPGDPNPPSGTSGIVVALGKNDISSSGSNSIKTLINDLKNDYSNIPVFVLKLSYYGTSTKSSDVDNFNDIIQEYCSSKDGVEFIDPTGTINDTTNKTIKFI